jgi:uncharacterized membrane protein YfcA
MSAGLIAVAALVVAIAAFVQGSTGLGFALIVAPVVGIFEPALLPVLLLVLMIPLNLYVAWRERTSVDRGGAGWITVGRFAGTPGGLWVLVAVPVSKLSLLIGVSTVAHCRTDKTSKTKPRYHPREARPTVARYNSGAVP